MNNGPPKLTKEPDLHIYIIGQKKKELNEIYSIEETKASLFNICYFLVNEIDFFRAVFGSQQK